MKNNTKKFLLLLTVIFCFNCSSSDDTEPMPDGGPEPETNPNPNKITTYDADVKTIIDEQCLRCHTIPLAEGATFPMRNYDETIDGINRDLLKFVQSSGANVMPPSGRLPQATIDIILDWDADGLREN